MRIRFWGVRGSLPSPLLPWQLKSKISAIMERLTPADLESPENRERFLTNLPPWLFGTVGGNTSCVTVQLKGCRELIVFDAGSGMRELGNDPEMSKYPVYHLFLSHFHWDHIMGLPFFNPAYEPAVRVEFYSPVPALERILESQMVPPFFPVRMESMTSRKRTHVLSGPLKINGVSISYIKLNHPGGSYSYRIDDGEHVFIYASDTGLSPDDFIRNEENTGYYSGADLLVIDCQYTLGEAIVKYNWGHSAFSLAVDFAANWKIKHMVLFHHDPAYDDHKLYNNLHSARLYTEKMNIRGIEISLAMEDMEIDL